MAGINESAPGGVAAPTEGLTTRRTYLLMDATNPTAVAVRLPARHDEFLRRLFTDCVEGIESDLAAKIAADAPERERNEREAATYRRLLRALDGDGIVPDAEVLRLLTEMAEAIDAENDYERVMLEHRAPCGLLAQLTEGGAS